MLLPLLAIGGVGYAIYHFSQAEKLKPSPKAAHVPAPAAGAATANFGARFTKYLERINKAAGAFKVAKAGMQAVGLPWAGAAIELKGTLDVVDGMAKNDTVSGAITADDYAALQHAMKKANELL